MTKADNFRFNSVLLPAIRRKPSIHLGVSGSGGSLEFSHPMTMILLSVLLLVQICSGEILYHRRDHRDQQLTPPLTQRTRSSVQTYNDALVSRTWHFNLFSILIVNVWKCLVDICFLLEFLAIHASSERHHPSFHVMSMNSITRHIHWKVRKLNMYIGLRVFWPLIA